MSNFEKRVKINKVIESQLPEFIVSEFPKAVDFLRQYYISQESQGNNIDIVDNLDQYLKLDNLIPEVIIGETSLSNDISSSDETITVSSTKGFPSEYGLLKIDDEIISYTGITTNTFTGCIRGFSGITGYNNSSQYIFSSNQNEPSLIFSQSSQANHTSKSKVENLSVLFLKEFYKKLKYTFVPGLEDKNFVADLNVGNFIKNARTFYSSKGTKESIKILFKVLYGVEASVIDLENRLIKPSSANYIRRQVVIVENISGNPLALEGQTVFKSTDINTNASVSNVDIFTRNNKSYYRLEFFVGYNENDLIGGNFNVPGNSKCLEDVLPGSSTISVDSTIGFDSFGTIISGENKITYTSKSINQFFGCNGVTSLIPLGSDVRSDETIYGYENGDITKRVDLRITGVISELQNTDTASLVDEGEEITVRNLGEIIENPEKEKTYKEVFSNSWIYNTSTRHQVSSISGSSFTLLGSIDKSSLKIGDTVDILFAYSNNIAFSGAIISTINYSTNQILLSNITGFTPVSTQKYDIRRKLKKSTSSNVNLLDKNNVYISDVLNVYHDEDENGYVASNSLPSYEINDDLIEESIPNGSSVYLSGYDSTLQAYSIIKFSDDVKFIDGDAVVYTAQNQELSGPDDSLEKFTGLSSGSEYYVSVIASNQIRLYNSRSLIGSSDYVVFSEKISSGSHRFTLKKHGGRTVSANKILRKFSKVSPQTSTTESKKSSNTVENSIGILIDGVEIINPKSYDKIYYGPIEKFEIINGGRDYDVVNPPKITISAGSGTTALVEPVITGSVKQVFVDPQDFDVKNILSISLTGGNGNGCVLEPILGKRAREVEFDSRVITLGGGIDVVDETITFSSNHNFSDGEIIFYDQNGNDPILTGDYDGSNIFSTGKLINGSQYVAKYVNDRTIKLFNSQNDYLAGINTIGFSTTINFGGIHKFKTDLKNSLLGVSVLDGGSGYQHRKLRIPSSSIYPGYDLFIHDNHGFSTGDIVTYSTTGSEVVGLSTEKRYSVYTEDSRSFKLIDVGIGGTFTENIIKNKYVDIKSPGTGHHIFQYPPIQVNVNVSYGSTLGGNFNFTPIITGNIIDAYLYEKGSGYGSEILNLHKKPQITIKNGKNAELRPIISNGRVVQVQILSGGSEYSSIPEILVIGDGTGAIIKPVIVDEKIIDAVVLNGGIGYSEENTYITVKSRGSGALADIRVRSLTLNDAKRYATYSKERTPKIFSALSKSTDGNHITYGIYGYSSDLALNYFDDGNSHSPIIGWAYDGCPIYGPFGYSDPNNVQSGVRIINPSYKIDIANIFDRPSSFAPGYFIEDYVYTDSGDLDYHNGRFCKTPDFPNGVYAYFCGVTTSTTSNSLEPKYPYFVGKSFKHHFISENSYLDQSFDFNNSSLIRNTYPYKLNDRYADYDFLVEPYESPNQQIVSVESVTKSSVEDIKILDGGNEYRIGDQVIFNEDGTNGHGLRAEVSEIVGKDIIKIETNFDSYSPCTLEWDNNNSITAYYTSGFDLNNGDTVIVNNISTSISNIFGPKVIGFSSETIGLAKTMNSYASLNGSVEDIFISSKFNNISIGNSISINSDSGNEIVRVLNDYKNGILRVKRFGSVGVAHSYGSSLNILSDRISLPIKSSIFDSKRDDLIYFNAKDSVGIGTTTGGAVSKSVTIGGITKSVSIPYRSIYLPNHPFKTGQQIQFTKSNFPGIDSLIVADNNSNLNTFQIPDTFTLSSTLYVINKGKDYVGLVTQVGLTTNNEGLYFYSDGSNDSEYLLSSNNKKITADISRVVSVVSVAQSHGLVAGDSIKLKVIPNSIVGLGSTSPTSVKFNESEQKLLVNTIGINSTQFDTNNNTITFENHGYVTGDKIFYESDEVFSGLTTGSYFVIKDSNDTFRLAETLYETFPDSEKSINIVGVGATIHNFSLINPQINVVKNSTLQFNLSDPSLIGYKFKIFTDKEFTDEFISAADTNDFNVIGVGTIGFGTASLSIKYSNNLPLKLYYSLEKNGYISTADTNIKNYSEINYVDSELSGSHTVFGISTDSFKISPNQIPDVLVYDKNLTEKIEYVTRASSVISGPIEKVKIISKGLNFKKLPKFENVNSKTGVDANLVAISTSIGKIKDIRFKDIGYEYPSDKTLSPQALIPPTINLDNLDTIDEIKIVSGGLKYINAPDLILLNDETKEIVDSSSLDAISNSGGSISEINQIAPIYGLKSDPHRIIAINNSNGVGISSIVTDNSGIATCTLSTPILGFSSPAFKLGDEIYVEGIELIGDGTGYNSENYGYQFFKVDSYVNTNPAQVVFSLLDESGVGLSTNPGIAKTSQSAYASIINKNDYPIIDVTKKRGQFLQNEQLFVDNGSGFLEEDLYIYIIRDNFIKTSGKYLLKGGEKIKGKNSGVVADVVSVDYPKSRFKIDYFAPKNLGWNNDIGKISEDFQVLPDNDYFQNLSYSIKSPITWDEFSSSVNSNLHPSGLKNFADVGILSSTKSSAEFGGATTNIVVLDILEEKRVDVINNFDNAIDYDIRTLPDRSKYLKLQNRKLADYTECTTNRVIIHDDISNKFSSRGFEDSSVEIEEIDTSDTHVRYTIQVVDPDTLNSQITELVLQTTTKDSILFEKHTSYTDELLGTFSADVDSFGRKVLLFTPTDRFDRDHDIKVLKKTFEYGFSGIGTQTIGSINLIGSSILGISSVGKNPNNIETIAEFSDSNFGGLFANIEIANSLTSEVNYIEAILDFDGSNTYMSEYYFDTSIQGYSAKSIGIVTATYDSTSGIVSFRVENDQTYPISVRANILSFTDISSGIETYRFLVPGQPPESERSVRLESTIGIGTTAIRVGSFDINTITGSNSIVRVSCGSSFATHQVSILRGDTDIIVSPGPFSAINNTSGLGTFGSETNGNNFYLNFYPDISAQNTVTQGFNEVFYTTNDFINIPNSLQYGISAQNVILSAYDSINGTRANKVNFDLTYQGRPIYKKVFDPSNDSIVNFETGIITITDHMFNTGEELIYSPKSTFIGVGQSAMGIGSTANYLGIVTDRLPEKVYPIAITPNTFKIATQRSYAELGIGVTFTDAGLGNAHEFEMTKKLTKSVVSLDGIVQQPITFTPVSHTLNYNSGSISAGIGTFNLSGISSIQPRDLVKIDNEYMKVVEVGFSTNVGGSLLGPINGIIQSGVAATIPTISVVRASVGSTATTHTDGSAVQVYRGSFNIVGSEIWFADPPKGNTRARRDESNLPYVKAQYAGRTFLRSNYDTNMLFDDISDQFTGIGKTYTMTVEGINTTGVTIGNGILFINGVFQTPLTINNSGNNYEFENDNVAGISSVVFTGITSTDGTYIKSDFDINQNQLPRGGLIVSLGSTPGLGYAPLVGAKVRANLDGSGSIVSITGISHTGPGQSISTASYNNQTGIIEITTSTDHNFVGGDRIKLVGLGFTYPSGGAGIVTYLPSAGLDYSYDVTGIISARTFAANVGTNELPHSYIGFGTVFSWYDLNDGSGYRGAVSIGVTDPNHTGSEADITAVVGAGGTLSFTVNNGGSGYVDPYIEIPEPIYENLEVVGVSRAGIGSTTDTGSNLLLNLKIGPSPSTVGIGSTLFLVESFEVSRPGYAFQIGDVFKPVGLVTAKDFSEPVSEFQLEVVETFQDYFSSWSFGEMNYIDSIETLQNGSRTRFPLYYNGQLLSFEINSNDPLSSTIDLNAVLLIFINGVIQQPGYAYNFSGGTSFEFSKPPKSYDKVDIFFYLGQNGVDVRIVDINETVKIGDDVFVGKHPFYPNTPTQTRNRTILDITGSDIIETDNYVGLGINEIDFRPIDWIKQKRDKYIKGDIVYKERDSIEPIIYPTARIIGDINSENSDIFVDDAHFFNYEETNYGITIDSVDGLIVQGTDPVSAAFTSTVSIAGTISQITITNPGLGYSTSSIPVKISAPPSIGIGIGTTASATASVSSGSVISVSITNPGFGYTHTNPPQVIVEIPKASTELITSISDVQGFSGIITGISTTAGTGGHPIALKINFRANASDANDLQPGYPLLVYNTSVGTGVTSVNTEDSSVVGIGTTFLDNVYIVNSKTNFGPDAEIVCNIHTNSNYVGIETYGSTTLPIGNISWGRLYNFTSRTNPVSIGVTGLVVDAGLSTFPTIQRRSFGLRNTGGIRKLSNI